MLRLWEKVPKSGEGLLSEARWDVVRQHHFLTLKQVSRLASNLGEEARQAHEDDRENQMTTWENWLRTDYRAACKWCKGVDNEKLVMVQRDDGTHAANAEQVHALIEQAWIPISKMHELGTQPTWPQFEASFGEHIPATCECTVDELNGENLNNARTKLKSTSAPGAEALPLELFEKMAQVLNLVSETGTWPVPLTCGLISLIQKGEGSAPQTLRPIGLMASVYRLWGSLRIRDIMRWQEKWADTALHGYRTCKYSQFSTRDRMYIT